MSIDEGGEDNGRSQSVLPPLYKPKLLISIGIATVPAPNPNALPALNRLQSLAYLLGNKRVATNLSARQLDLPGVKKRGRGKDSYE